MSYTPYSGELYPWQPEHLLRTYSLQEIRFSGGFLRSDLKERFLGLAENWLPVFDICRIRVDSIEYIAGFQFPGDLEFLFVVQRDDEYGLIGVDDKSYRELAKLFLASEAFSDVSGEAVIEYLARKLFFSLTKAWPDNGGSVFFGRTDVGELDIEGHVELLLELSGKKIHLHIGLGPATLQQLDQSLKGGNRIASQQKQLVRIGIPVPDKAHQSIMRGGALLLDQDTLQPIFALLPDGRVIQGRLGQFNQRFAFESMGPITGKLSPLIEIAQADVSDLDSVMKLGYIFLTRTIVSRNATLVVENNGVAELALYTSQDRFVVKAT